MPPPWKLVVEDLGRIGHAEIEARPLLLFVGANNTGKTYLASLLWGLLALTGELPVVEGEAYRRCVAWIEERFARREQEPTFEITPEVHADLVQVVNDTLRLYGATLAARTFNKPAFTLGTIELQDVARYEHTGLLWSRLELEGKQVAALTITRRDRGYLGWFDQPARFVYVIALVHVLGAQWIRRDVGPLSPGPVFLPASRTGFMLLYRSLAEQSVSEYLIKSGAPRRPAPDLTTPAADFVRLLTGLRSEVGAYPEEAAFLEQAMGGRLALRADVGLPQVLYEHAAGGPPLPMELSSSLVTELAPVVLTLRHASGYQILFIEEPEAHLHPKLQRRLAQVVVRLVRKGLCVWITTHSENFCQQINNFMKLGAHPRRAEMQAKHGYEACDYLLPDDVGGYQFEVDDASGRTVVAEIEKTSQGLVMPTFNRELADLTDEALDLELPESDG
jgi:energy-coupling factor transporter ATP-binding protein EcfA2